MRMPLTGLFLVLYLCPFNSISQDERGGEPQGLSDRVIQFPSKLFSRIQNKTANLDQQLTKQTEKYLAKMAKREARLKKKLLRMGDTTAAKQLFDPSSQQSYAALVHQMQTDTGNRSNRLSGEYQPNTDSLQGSLTFLQQNPRLLSAGAVPGLQNSIDQFRQLQGKLQDAGDVKEFVRQRKEPISQYLSQYTHLPAGLNKELQGLNQDLYYYSQQVREYKEMLNSPDQLEKKALSLLNQLPAFQQFMKNNSQIAGLFNLPGNYASPQALTGLQTRDQVTQLIQNQISAGGAGAEAALQANLQSAQSQLDGFKNKLDRLGGGSGDIEMPGFKPNDQKKKTFWKRLEYGTDFQTTPNTYFFPTTSDLGLTVGYKLNDRSTVGLGTSYKLGWGSGINHIAFSSQGTGLRSFLDIKIKSGFSATGGLEYNYARPFASLQQIRQLDQWVQSGLVGISKTVSLRSRVFKKTRLQLLWDFLSYQQIPKTQPILFRIGYGWH